MIIKSLTVNPLYTFTMLGDGGNPWTIEVPSGIVSANKVILINSHAVGGATFLAPTANGNVDGGGNTGWLFSHISTVATQYAENILATEFLANGVITNTGGENATRRGFCVRAAETGDPNIDDDLVFAEDGSFGEGSYALLISGLQSLTSYRFRAFVESPGGIGYGNVIQIITLTSPPIVVTQSAESLLATEFWANGIIANTGGQNATRRGFCYKAGAGDPTVDDLIVAEDGDWGGGSYALLISGLQSLTQYRFRAFAENPGGVGYGDVQQIVTMSGAPPIITIGGTEVLGGGGHADVLRLLFPIELAGELNNDLALEGRQLDASQTSAELILKEMLPQFASDTIADWERVYGLIPAAADTLQMRQIRLITKMRERGGLSIPYFLTLAVIMGYDNIVIEELLANTDGYGAEGIFRWRITFTGTPLYYFRAGQSRAGDRLVDGPVATAMEGLFVELKPAHTQVIFAYT